MKRKLMLVVLVIGIGLAVASLRAVELFPVSAAPQGRLHANSWAGFSTGDTRRILEGLRLSPVPLNLRGKDIALVGLGSYLVNVGGCADCHSNPTYAPGGDPFRGEPKKFNTEGFLAGGNKFGPVITSRNLTPDKDGLPAGLTWSQFLRVMRTGVDLKHLPPQAPSAQKDLLQVMPWPVIGQMTTHDLRAMYEYLRAIPSRPGFPR